jgi:sulfite dehydrogenase
VKKYLVAAGVALALVTASGAQQDEPPRNLTPGKGSDLTTARCATCHDARHITRTRLSRGEWEYNIKNMIDRGAPMAASEIPIILEYLATYYNRDSPAPAPDPAAAAYGMDAGGGDPVQQMLTANACSACHTLDARVIGPSFREIAAKFAADADAVARLSKKVRDGGSGNWGNLPMPPHPHLSDVDLGQMVSWILKQR